MCSEEFYRNIPVCSDNKGQVMFPTITTWSWGTGPQPCKGHLEQSPCCTRHLSRESTRCFSNRHTCHSSTGGQGQIQQKNLITGLYPSPQDRRTPIQTLQPLTAPSPSPLVPPYQKMEEPFPQPLCRKPKGKRLHPLSQTEVMVKEELFVNSPSAVQSRTCNTPPSTTHLGL